MSQPAATNSSSNAVTPPAGGPLPATRPQGAGASPITRQFVNFAFYKLDPSFRRLPNVDKEHARAEFEALMRQSRPGMLCLSYSTVGLRPDADFLLWRISATPDDFQAQSQAINRTRLGGYLGTPWSFVSMTKRSMYIDKLDPFHTSESRTHIVPGKRKYLFVYPFVKTRDWYLLPLEQRQAIMDAHIKVGNKYPSVKLNSTYGFCVGGQEFVVGVESDEPKDFLDLVMELRETESSRYTQRDTPIFTCIQISVEGILEQLF